MKSTISILEVHLMGDISNIFTPAQLGQLSEQAKEELRQELTRQLDAAPEIRSIITAHQNANESLRRRLQPTLDRLLQPR
jgi:hypothetical protein